jgi:hypothetical protein
VHVSYAVGVSVCPTPIITPSVCLPFVCLTKRQALRLYDVLREIRSCHPSVCLSVRLSVKTAVMAVTGGRFESLAY